MPKSGSHMGLGPFRVWGKAGLLCALALAAALAAPPDVGARRSSGPPSSGLSPSDSTRELDGVASGGRALSRTAEGGMGFTDAYGNTISDRPPEEPSPRKRLPAGAYGRYGKEKTYDRPLPEPAADPARPAWSFQ